MASGRLAFIVLLSGVLTARALAQAPSTPDATLAGVVMDPSGGVMQAVTVRVFEDGGDEPLREVKTDAEGRFAVELPVGEYSVEVFAPGFLLFDQVITVGPETERLEVVLDIEPVELAADVTPAEQLIADTTMSLTSETLAGDELLDLPRTEEDMARYLLLLAGADITGDLEEDILANFVIDGFADNRLPSPDQISQIVVDPNSLSADGDGRPRIEIVTRPGSGQWRRSVDVGFADESLNALRPGESRKEPRQTRAVEVEVQGPVVPNVLEMSFQLATRADDRAGDSLHAVTAAGDIFKGVVQPEREQEFEIGADLQINTRHRLDTQFTFGTSRSTNGGVGGFSLPDRGSDERSTDWRFRISERMFTEDTTNNVRFQISQESSKEVPVHDGFAIDVADAFRGGGGTNRGDSDAFTARLDNDLRLERAGWNLRWGGQLRYDRERNIDRDNFNGTFEFASLHDYCVATGLAGVNCAGTQQIVNAAVVQGIVPAYVDARGRAVEITGVPVVFAQAFGNADLEFSELSFNTHIQGDRQFGEQASLRLGLRYEGTNHSRDFLRLNPTVNFQYQLAEDTLVSAGAQLNFRDFTDYERLLRNDGSTYETELAISSPAFPDPFQGGTVEIGDETASRWVLDPDYQSPRNFSPQVSVTQQVPGDIRLTLSYRASYGHRERRTRNINAPYPGTPLPDEILDLLRDARQDVIDRMRPFYPQVGNITQIETTGRSVNRRVRLGVRPRGTVEFLGMGFSGNLTYTYRSEHDDDDFNNPYVPEWGPSRRDHGVQSQFRLSLPDDTGFANPLLSALARATYEGVNLNFRFRAETGRLYSIQSGRDLNGDQSSRDRPPDVARNTEVGPGSWNLDLTFTKDYGLGESVVEGGGGRGSDRSGGRGGFGRDSDGRRIRFQARVANLLNHTQPRAYGRVVTSPLFGQPTGYTGGRTVTLSMNLNF